jgi:SM-20-related protein
MMTTPGLDDDFDLYLIRSFFDEGGTDELLEEMRRAPGAPATVYGRGDSGAVDDRVRKVTRLRLSAETVGHVSRRLAECRAQIGEHFRIGLTLCEEPQFLCYRPGDFFVAHQDGNTGLIRSEREQSRKISIVIFLNRQSAAPEPDAYCGGSLVFSDWHPGRRRADLTVPAEAGTLVAFRSEVTHEVTPVTHGERYSIVSWYG